MLLRKRLITVMTPEQKVWYFFSPMETPGRSRSVGDGFWRESSAKEDIVNEQGHKIGERRSRCCRNWTMQEYRLLDSQHAEVSCTVKKTMKDDDPSNNQDSTKADELISPFPFYLSISIHLLSKKMNLYRKKMNLCSCTTMYSAKSTKKQQQRSRKKMNQP